MVCLAAWSYLNSEYAKPWIAKSASEFLSKTTGADVSFKTISFHYPCILTFEDLYVGDSSSFDMSAKKACIELSLSELLDGQINSGKIVVTGFNITDLSSGDKGSKITLNVKREENALSADFAIEELPQGLFIAESISFPHDNIRIDGSAHTTIDALKLFLNNSNNHENLEAVSGNLTIRRENSISIQGTYTLTPDRSLQFHIDPSQIGTLSFNGVIFVSGDHKFDGTHLAIRSDNFDFLQSFIKEPPSGTVDLGVFLEGTSDNPCLFGTYSGTHISYKDILIDRTEGQITINKDHESWFGNVTSINNIANIEFNASSQFSWDPGIILKLSDFVFETPGATAHGALTFVHPGQWVEGNLSGHCNNFSLLDKHLPSKLECQMDFSTQFNNDGCDLFIQAPQIDIQDSHIHDLCIKITLKDVLNKMNGTIFSSIGKASGHSIEMDNVTFLTTIDSERNWPFFLSIGDDKNDALSLQTNGNWHLRENSFECTLGSLIGTFENTPFHLDNTLTARWGEEGFTISPLTLTIDKGSLQTSLDYTSPHFHSTVHFEDLPLKLLANHHLPSNLQGLISGNGIFNGTVANPAGQLNLKLHEIMFNGKGFEKIPSANANMIVYLNENELSFSGDIITSEHPPIHFESHLPLTISLMPPTATLNKQAAISALATASGEIAPILQLLFNDAPPISGMAKVQISVDGSLDAPQIHGSADLTEGAYEITDIGAVIKNITAHFEGSGSKVILRNLTADDGGKGQITGTGTLDLDISQKFPFVLNLNIQDSALLNQDYAKGSFNGLLTLKGNMDEGTLSGNATTNSMAITIPEEAPALMNSVEVTYINQAEDDQHSPLPSPTSPSWPLHFDINVTAPKNISITGEDLTSEWKGHLMIQGSTPSPTLSGEFKIIHGQYLFNGKDFEINQGTITLEGDAAKKSTLYVIASKDLDKVKVEVIVKGPIKNPAISFRSNPPLPQREILSWILFNRGSSEISPFQGSQLTETITNLKSNNKSKGPDILTKMRNALGIDRFDISRDENSENGVSVQVGKYISQNVFVSLKKSDVNRIAVEAALMPNIKLQAQVGDDSEGQILLKWKHDY